MCLYSPSCQTCLSYSSIQQGYLSHKKFLTNQIKLNYLFYSYQDNFLNTKKAATPL